MICMNTVEIMEPSRRRAVVQLFLSLAEVCDHRDPSIVEKRFHILREAAEKLLGVNWDLGDDPWRRKR